MTSIDWTAIPIMHIEDLADAVLGAGLDATQMSRGSLGGGIAFSISEDMTFSSGLIYGRVALSGPLSLDRVTIGVGMHIAAGSRHWLNEVETGNVAVFLPGDEHEAIYGPGSLYATVSLSADTLEEEAAKRDLVLDQAVLGGTGIHDRNLRPAALAYLNRSFRHIHCAGATTAIGTDVGTTLLDALIQHLARPPYVLNGRTSPGMYGRIVRRAQDYIHMHLSDPLSIDALTSATYTSRRTLFRAFATILDETPHSYIRRLRLHRIRHDLACREETACTIALIANQWGLSDFGRMAGWYQRLFGELPCETRAKALDAAIPEITHTEDLAQTT